jgi:SAM-dependent methyltransferase
MSHSDQRRLYDDLAWTWPIISPPEDYIPEGEYFAGAMLEHVEGDLTSLLHIGCGGGHNDYTLKRFFDVTGVDASPKMLGLAKRLNPDVSYVQGDMRTVRLRSKFDAVAILDSINYMLSERDLRSAFETAYAHLRPGGVFLTYVEQTPERFRQNVTKHWTRGKGDVEITFIENSYDPDHADTTYESVFVFLIREHGQLRIETDRHLGGIFTMDIWYDNLRSTGFEVNEVNFVDRSEDGEPLHVLVCTRGASRPSAGSP